MFSVIPLQFIADYKFQAENYFEWSSSDDVSIFDSK